jgi:hypothetical protein
MYGKGKENLTKGCFSERRKSLPGRGKNIPIRVAIFWLLFLFYLFIYFNEINVFMFLFCFLNKAHVRALVK